MSSESKSKLSRKQKIKQILSKYRRSGEISIEAKNLARKLCKPGKNVWELCEEVEGFIREEGAKPAFPMNVSINNEAAHYSAEIHDERTIPENSIVKIDLGVQIDGYLVDTAFTANFNDDLEDLTQASKDALEAVIAVAKPGIKVTELGKLIERIITQAGYEPVRNLSGHQIKRYNLHAGLSIPNTGPGYLDRNPAKLKPGRIYAIEPFASSGKGWVKNGPHTNIFRFTGMPKKSKSKLYKLAVKYKKKVGVLPFSPRHLYEEEMGKDGRKIIARGLNKLIKANVVMGYPVLVDEEKRGMISQHEHTLRMTKDGCEVLTSNKFS